MGSGWKGSCASWHRMYEAAAMPNMAGMVPRTGMVRTRKFGTICMMARMVSATTNDTCVAGTGCQTVAND